MPASTFFAIIFFLMLITLGLDSTVSTQHSEQVDEWGQACGNTPEYAEHPASDALKCQWVTVLIAA